MCCYSNKDLVITVRRKLHGLKSARFELHEAQFFRRLDTADAGGRRIRARDRVSDNRATLAP